MAVEFRWTRRDGRWLATLRHTQPIHAIQGSGATIPKALAEAEKLACER